MARTDLQFDVGALDRASATFARVALAVERLERQLDKIDGKRVTAHVNVDVDKAHASLVKLDKSVSDSVIHVAALGKALKTLTIPAGLAAATPQLLSLGSAAMELTGTLGLIPAVASAAMVGIGAAKVGASGFGAALSAIATQDMKKFEKAMDRLGPSAEKAAGALNDFWAPMQEAAQEALFENFDRMIGMLAQRTLPALARSIIDINGVYNDMIGSVVDVVTESDKIEPIFARITQTFRNLEPAAAAVASTWLTLTEVGSRFLPGLATGISNAALAFERFVTASAASGRLEEWIQGGLDRFEQLWRITKNVGEAFGALFNAADLAGIDFLDSLERATRGIADALKSMDGQSRTATLLRELAETFRAIWEAGEPIHRLLGELALEVLPPLLQVVQLLAPALVPIAQALLAIKLAGMALGGLRTVPEWFGSTAARAEGASSALRQLREEMRLQQALAAGAGQSIGAFGAALAVAQSRMGPFLRNARDASSEFHNLSRSASALGERLQSSIPQAAERAGEALQRGLSNAAERVAVGFERLGQVAVSGVGRTVDAVKSLPAQLGRLADRAGDALVSGLSAGLRGLDRVGDGIVNGLAASFRGLDRVGDAALNGLQAGFRATTTAGEAMVRGLTVGFQTLARTGESVVNGLAAGYRGLSSAGDAMVSAAQAGYRGLTAAGDAVVTGLARLREAPAAIGAAFTSGFSAATTAAANAARSIVTAADNIPAAFVRIGQAAGNLGNTLATGLSRGLTAMGTFSSAVGALGTTLGSGLMRAGSSLVSFLGGPWGFAFAAASVALGVFAGKQAEAAQKTAEAKQALEQQRQTLDQVSGAVTEATVKQKALELAQSGLLSKAEALKVSTQDYTQASLGNADALKRVQTQIESQVQAVIAASPAYKSSSLEIQNMGLSLADLSAAAQGSPAALAKVDEAVRRASGGSLEAQQHLRMVADALIAAGGPAADLGRQLLEANGGLEQNVRQTQQAAQAAGQLQQQMQGVATAFAAVPGTKTITVEASSISGVRAELEQMGFQIVNLPDGQVKITAPTDEALKNLFALKTTIDSTTGTVIIDGNVDPATGKVQQTIQLADGSIGTITVDARPDPATGKIQGTVAFADNSTGTITIDGRPDPATGKINATVTYGNGQTATITVDANTSPAMAKLKAFLAQKPTITVNTQIRASGSAQVRPAGGAVIGYARGGVVPGYQPGRDTVPAMLSRGEAVLVPELVRQIGARNILAANAAASGGRAATVVGKIGAIANGTAKFAGGGLISAAEEILAHWRKGGQVFEDFSFRGASSNVGKYNDQIASRYRGGDVGSFLRGLTKPTATTGAGKSVATAAAAAVKAATAATAPAASGAAGHVVHANPDVVSAIAGLRGEVRELRTAMAASRPITVEDRSGNPTETARQVQLALRSI